MRGTLRWITAVVLAGATTLACSSDDKGSGPPDGPDLARFTTVVMGLDNPVFVTAPPGDTTRVFIVEKAGLVRILKNGVMLTQPFLDITDQTSKGDEQGLLGLAFAPDYGTSGRFFVSYTAVGGGNAGHSVLSWFLASTTNPDSAVKSETVLFEMDQPFANHNGGMITFGPDGYLYVGFGDGGDGGDPLETGQDLSDELGSILRVNVAGGLFSYPGDNPFAETPGAVGSIWQYGLRNPWRFSFDRQTGDMYIADVGQNQYEEVNVVPAGNPGGQNFGWDDMEGKHCYEENPCGSNTSTRPFIEYSHGGGRCSVTGGYVYRGAAVPAIAGLYFYADYCSGTVWSFRYGSGSISEERSWSQLKANGSITSFGEDGRGELYVTTQSGRLLRFAQP